MTGVHAALALILLASACGDPDGRHPVDLALLLPGDAPELETKVRSALQAALTESAIFAPDGAPGAKIRGEASVAHERPEEGWVVRVQVEVPEELRAFFVAPTIQAAATAGAGDLPESDVLVAATRRAVAGLEAQCRLARGDIGGIEVLLGSGEPLQILIAVRYIGDREASEQATRLLPLLRSEDARVRLAVLNVLGAVGTGDHAAAIVREAHRLDPGATGEAYRALARLGGDDAVGFLRFAAANEDDPELRAEAERALTAALAGKPRTAAEGPRGVDLPKLARGHRQ